MTLDFAEWLADYEQRDPVTGKPKRDFYDLGAKIFTDVAWAVVGAAVGTALMAGFLVATGGGIGIVIAIGAIGIAIAIGAGLAYIDSHIGITPAIAQAARDAAVYLDGKLPRDYANYQQSIENMTLGGAP